jgi:hypothetical protein
MIWLLKRGVRGLDSCRIRRRRRVDRGLSGVSYDGVLALGVLFWWVVYTVCVYVCVRKVFIWMLDIFSDIL